MPLPKLCGITPGFPGLSPASGRVPYAFLDRSPLGKKVALPPPLDLHFSGTPQAFVLSQDQTLHPTHLRFLIFDLQSQIANQKSKMPFSPSSLVSREVLPHSLLMDALLAVQFSRSTGPLGPPALRGQTVFYHTPSLVSSCFSPRLATGHGAVCKPSATRRSSATGALLGNKLRACRPLSGCPYNRIPPDRRLAAANPPQPAVRGVPRDATILPQPQTPVNSGLCAEPRPTSVVSVSARGRYRPESRRICLPIARFTSR